MERYQLFPVSVVNYIFKEEIKSWLKTERNPVTSFYHFRTGYGNGGISLRKPKED